MFRRLGLLLAALALFTIAGGHWLVLQSVAWGQMLSDYSRGGSFATAVEKTFSGKFPCGMCRQIEEGRKSEERKAPALAADKQSKEFLAAAEVALPARRVTATARPAWTQGFAAARAIEPATPIPIAVPASIV